MTSTRRSPRRDAAATLGEMRRQLAKGFPLLNKEAWTPQLDYRSSLALRSERTVVDSSVPYALRLEQIYRPAIDLDAGADDEGDDSQARCRAARPGAAAAKPLLKAARELGTFDGVSRDLRESPFAMELDLSRRRRRRRW